AELADERIGGRSMAHEAEAHAGTLGDGLAHDGRADAAAAAGHEHHVLRFRHRKLSHRRRWLGRLYPVHARAEQVQFPTDKRSSARIRTLGAPSMERMTPDDALAALEDTGREFIEVLRHGSLTVEIYKPQGV